jgi:hypothetical protein
MRQRTLIISLFVLLGFVATPGSLLAKNFNFECRSDRYVAVPLGQAHEFQAPLTAVPPGNDSVDVIFEPHLPALWGAQWCHTYTGLCYASSQRIRLVSGTLDTLEIDILPSAGTPRMGWVDLTIRSVEDPLDVARCTYTLYSGMPVPAVSYTVNSSDNTRWMASGTVAEFFSPIRNNLPFDMDTLMVRKFQSIPGDWTSQFCQVSTGICYPYSTGMLPLWPGLNDNLQVEAFLGAAPSTGGLDFVIQSKRNPSIAQYANYRIFLGSWPAGAPSAAADARPRAWAEPNPSTGPTSIMLQSPVGGTGELTIFGADGRVVRSFPRMNLAAGVVSVRWDGGDDRGETAPSGIYYYRFLVGGASHRGTLVRTR